MPLYLKGYRLDGDKIAKLFNCEDPTDYKPAIIRCIARDAYRYIANGFEPNGDLNLIIVMKGGNDAVALTQTPMPDSEDATLLDIARKVCTAGVWPCFDGACVCSSDFWGESAVLMGGWIDVDNPRTFWAEWVKHGRCRLGEIKEESKGQ
ncbi:hypothetical protein BJ912DRAFT_38608 [Pholiota molesta]|nr:hypothetical protein BJ912DRAFT_38608 [Pholiota molesta]